MTTLPFAPHSTTVTVASSNTASASGELPKQAGDIRVYNASSVVAHVKFGGSTVAATTSDTPIAPGETFILVGNGATHVAAILGATGTGNVYFTVGRGGV